MTDLTAYVEIAAVHLNIYSDRNSFLSCSLAITPSPHTPHLLFPTLSTRYSPHYPFAIPQTPHSLLPTLPIRYSQRSAIAIPHTAHTPHSLFPTIPTRYSPHSPFAIPNTPQSLFPTLPSAHTPHWLIPNPPVLYFSPLPSPISCSRLPTRYSPLPTFRSLLYPQDLTSQQFDQFARITTLICYVGHTI